MALGYPLINGVRFDASSVELQLNGKRYLGVTEIAYEHSLEPGKVRGLNPQVLGLTRGLYDAGGTFTILREEFQDLQTDILTIAGGFLEANFLATVTYSELPPAAIPTGAVASTSTDIIAGIRMTGSRHRVSAGSADGLTVEVPFIARYILIGGSTPLNTLLKMVAAATAP